VWWLNLDADREMAEPRGYAPPRAVAERTRSWCAFLRRELCRPGDHVLGEDDLSAYDRGRCAVSMWCPTPTALRRLHDEGLAPVDAPAFDVVRRVNHRRFCADLGQPLDDADFISDACAIATHTMRPTETGWWLLKRPFGFSGSGRRRITSGALEASDRDWIHASLKRTGGLCEGGLQVEPWLERRADFVVHGFVTKQGAAHIGPVCQQHCDERGAWQKTELLPEGVLSADDRTRLIASAEQAAEALIAAAYFGPFGIDAYSYQLRGSLHLNPRSEINARYTMGWGIGMAADRCDLGS
jgi:hypothetical protein